MKNVVLFLLLSAPVLCDAQIMIILHDGSSFEIKENKVLDNDMIVFRSRDKEEITVPYNSIKEVFTLLGERYMAFAKIIFKNNHAEWDYLELDVDGQIRIFKRLLINRYGLPGQDRLSRSERAYEYYIGDVTSDDPYMALKNVRFLNLSGTTAFKREEVVKYLRGDSALLRESQMMGDKLSRHELITLIKAYNTKHFVKEETSKPLSTVMFYLFSAKKRTGQIIVNDSETYDLGSFQPVPIKIPIDVLTKVCVQIDDKKYCELVRANPFVIPYREFHMDISGDIQAEWVWSKDAVKRIQEHLARTR